MATYSSAQSIAVKQVASGGYVVQAGEYAEVTYIMSSYPLTLPIGGIGNGSPAILTPNISKIFGPGQTVQASFTAVNALYPGASNPGGGYDSTPVTCTYSFSSGVVFKNMPS